MAICRNCGNNINDEQFCPKCGSPTGQEKMSQEAQRYAYYGKSGGGKNIFGMICGIAMIVSLFLPFASINFLGMSQSFSLSSYVQPTVIIGVAGLLVLVCGLKGSKIGGIITGIIACIVAIYYISTFDGGISGSEYENLISKSIGAYLLIISGVLSVIAGAIHKE